MTLTPHHGHHLADHGPSSSSHSTPKVTPCVSALASPTAPLSRAASPRPLALRDVDDDSFAPSALAQETDSVHAVSPSLTPSLPAPASQDENHFASPAETSHSPQKLQPLGETLVISGGSGFNDLLGAAPGNTTYVMPISDNGGSSSEIIRTLSGPSIGDIRSRLVRLIPLTTSPPASGRPVPPPSNDCLHALLSYRLPTVGRTRDIKAEWLDLLEGKHRLWKGIEADRKEVVRGFLVHFQSEILRRAHRNFNLRGLSVGNAFLSAAQMFFRSIQSAIFLFSATTLVAGSGASVLPCINTNHTATIAAELEDGSTIVGQCEISHPAPTPRSRGEMVSKTDMGPDDTLRQAPRGLRDGPAYSPAVTLSSGIGTPSSTIFDPLSNVGSDLHAALRRSTETAYQQWRSVREAPTQRTTVGTLQDGLEPDEEDDAASQAADIDDPDEDGVEEQAGGNIVFSKDASKDEEPLPSRIRDIFYINSYRNIVWPAPNSSYLTSLSRIQTLIYSCGSLYTSIIPSLALRGVASAISRSQTIRFKVLLLNTSHDRETPGYSALDFIAAIQRALSLSDSPGELSSAYRARDFITHLVYHRDGQVVVDRPKIEALGIRCITVGGHHGAERPSDKAPRFNEDDVRHALELIAQQEHSSDLRDNGLTSPKAEKRQQMEGFTYLPLQ